MPFNLPAPCSSSYLPPRPRLLRIPHPLFLAPRDRERHGARLLVAQPVIRQAVVLQIHMKQTEEIRLSPPAQQPPAHVVLPGIPRRSHPGGAAGRAESNSAQKSPRSPGPAALHPCRTGRPPGISNTVSVDPRTRSTCTRPAESDTWPASFALSPAVISRVRIPHGRSRSSLASTYPVIKKSNFILLRPKARPAGSSFDYSVWRPAPVPCLSCRHRLLSFS